VVPRTQIVTFTVAGEHAQHRVDAYLALHLPWRSRRSLTELLRAGAVEINGQRTRKKSHRLAPGDLVTLEVPRSPDADVDLGAIALEIIYEDDDLVVVNKSGDLAVHPASTCQYRNLLRRLQHHYAHEQIDPQVEISVLHRLDRTTSGVVAFAKRRSLVDFYTRQFAARTTLKEYVAIVHGRVEDEQRIEAPIHIPPAQPSWVGPGGKPSRTDVRPLEISTNHSRLAIVLHTGRQHQIRVHLSSEGHPLLWDELYGDSRDASWPIDARPLLHAAKLCLDHRDGLRRCFEASVPEDMEQAWRSRSGRHERGLDPSQ